MAARFGSQVAVALSHNKNGCLDRIEVPMNKTLAVLLAAAAAMGVAIMPAHDAAAQTKKAAAAPKAPKAYVGPSSHLACGKLKGDARDACIRKLPVSVFSKVNVKAPAAAAAPAATKAAAAPAVKAPPPPKAYVGPSAHLACSKLKGDARDNCIRKLPVMKGPGFAAATATKKK